METPEALAYAESVRAIEQQVRELDELRSRTGLLLAGASIVGSFLGAEALRGDDFDFLAGLAILAFLGVLGLAAAILWPRRDAWTFALGAKVLLEDWRDQKRDGGFLAMQRFAAEQHEANWDTNQKKIDQLYGLFQWAIGALGCEVILWTVKLTA